MRIIREYACDLCGATKEAPTDLAFNDDIHPHRTCTFRQRGHWIPQLSPVTTTFAFADRSGRKRVRQ